MTTNNWWIHNPAPLETEWPWLTPLSMFFKNSPFPSEPAILSPYLTVQRSILNLDDVIKLEFMVEKQRLIIIAFQSPW